MPFLKRGNNHERIFSSEEYEALKIIKCLKKSGLALKEIKQFMQLVQTGDPTLRARFEIFSKQRENVEHEIEKLHEILRIINYKCWYYSNASEIGDEQKIKNLPLENIPEEFREIKENLSCN